MSDDSELIDAARAVRDHAHAPYSGFRVGAALLGEDGNVYLGCNVENASFGATQCAERTAVGAMVAAGCRGIVRIAIFTEATEPTLPCGICRQVLREFSQDLPVTSATPTATVSTTLAELLPMAFQFRP